MGNLVIWGASGHALVVADIVRLAGEYEIVGFLDDLQAQRPDVIIETGVAHGGSLVFHASLCELLGHGRVIGVDVEIRPHNRQAIDAHFLRHRIELVEGDSTAPAIVEGVRSRLRPGERVMVILDSDHTKQHVSAELEMYHRMVSPGGYIVVADGVMAEVADAPRGRVEWSHDNPLEAAAEFLRAHPEFNLDPPRRSFSESPIPRLATYMAGGWLRRVA